MYHDDHLPLHIHVEYQGHEALVCIDDGTIINQWPSSKEGRQAGV